MKLFKNRGDIYISKSDYKSSKEERILLSLLCVGVVFTIVFVVMLGNKYDHNIKNFFATDKEIQSSDSINDTSVTIPAITGKTNYILFETNDAKNNIFYVTIIQADCDNLAYKVTTLSPNTKINGKTINEIFLSEGVQKLKESVGIYLGIELNYYIQFTNSSIKDFMSNLGNFNFNSSEKVKFSGGEGEDSYSLRVNEGEQTIDHKEFSSLMRYYVNEKGNYQIPNEVMLYAFIGLINEDNNEKSEKLFRIFINDTITNITVRDFANSSQNVTVFSQNAQSIKIYSCVSEYDSEYNLTENSVSNIQNYFTK